MIKNSFWRLVTQFVVMFLALVISVIIKRTLGPENMGYYAVVNLTVTLAFILGYLGLNQAITYHRAQKTYQDHHLWTFLVFFGAVWGIILGGIGLVVVNILSAEILGLDHTSRSFLSIGLFLISTRLLNAYLKAYLLGGKSFSAFNAIGVIDRALMLALLVLTVLMDDAITAVYIAWLITPIVMTILLLWITRERWSLKQVSMRATFREAFHYGYKAYITNFMQFFNYRLDQYVLNYYRGPVEVGVYTAAVSLGNYLWQLSNAVQTILFPTIAGLSEDEARKLTLRANRNTLFLSALGACVLAVTGHWLICFLYGDAYVDAYHSLLWLLPGIVAFSIVKVLTASLSGLGHPEVASIVTAFAMIFTLSLDFLWIPDRGLVGAAQASTVAYMAAGVLSVIMYLRYVKTPLKHLLLIQPEDLRAYLKAARRLQKSIEKRRLP